MRAFAQIEQMIYDGSARLSTSTSTIIGGNVAYYPRRVHTAEHRRRAPRSSSRPPTAGCSLAAPVHLRVLDDLQRVMARQDALTIDDTVKDHLRACLYGAPRRLQVLVTQPFAHQLEGLLWAYNMPRCGLLRPGARRPRSQLTCSVSRTRQRLSSAPRWFCALGAPSSLGTETKTTSSSLEGSKKKKLELIEAATQAHTGSLLVTYESAATLVKGATRVRYTMLVLDESHRITEKPTSIRTWMTWYSSEGRPRRVLLRGTPTLATRSACTRSSGP